MAEFSRAGGQGEKKKTVEGLIWTIPGNKVWPHLRMDVRLSLSNASVIPSTCPELCQVAVEGADEGFSIS